LEEVKNWCKETLPDKEEEYFAIVLAGRSKAGVDAGRVCTVVDITDVTPCDQNKASLDDLTTACTLLRQVQLGMAYSLHCTSPPFSNDTFQKQRDEFKRLFNNTDRLALVPAVKDEFYQEYRHCLKIQFKRDSTTHHAPPDPLLLVVKTAANWSTRVGQNLLPGDEYHDDVYSDDDLDDLAEEQALEWLEERNRPKTLEDLARGLHQPNGYHAKYHDNDNNNNEDSKTNPL
jgi:hypothetical protein